MKIKKSLLSVCLSISLMFGCLVPSITVYAVGDSWTSAQSYTYFENHFDDINTRLNGVIINQNRLQESFEDYLSEYRYNYNIASGTSLDTWVGDNISGSYQNGSIGVSDLSFSETFRQAMRDWCDAYIETNTGFYYLYSYNVARFINNFNDQDQYHAFLDCVNDNDDKIILVGRNVSDSGLIVFNDPCDFVYDNKTYTAINAYIYQNWNKVNTSDVFTRYSYNSNSKTYEVNNISYVFDNAYFTDSLQGSLPTINNGNIFIDLNSTVYQVYKTEVSMRNGTEGVQDYYVTDSYNSTISGSYNTTTSNIESTINSNNVNNYINNYYVENGKYPTSGQVNVYITNNINNGGGNNNGGGDDNGGSGNNWDFGFLGTIGELIAELISGLGEIVGGILSAITSIISSLREGIPNTIGLFLDWFFPFLPTEIVALIELSILCAVILGVVRLIRGH